MSSIVAASPGPMLCATGVEALAFVARHHPDVVLMDLRMPELDGVGATRRLATEHPAVRVLGLTTYDTEADVLPAIEAGATVTCSRTRPSPSSSAPSAPPPWGEPVLAPAVAAHLMAPLRRPAPGVLTARELDVLRLVAAGATNRAAAS